MDSEALAWLIWNVVIPWIAGWQVGTWTGMLYQWIMDHHREDQRHG